jgi:hypothetical protein
VKQLKVLASKQLEDLGGVLPLVYSAMLALFKTSQVFGMATTNASQASSKSSIKLLRFASADHTQSSETKRRDLLNGKHILTCDGVWLEDM